MLKKLPKEQMGTSNLGWLQSRFHFSFAEYRNYDNMNFGVLRVLNDDLIKAQTGFDTHPHQNMEIISYVVKGEITHKDSMGNQEVVKRGEVQYLSAGKGIYHSEYNKDENNTLRLLQIWIVPPKEALPRLYGQENYTQEQRKNTLLNIVSSQEGEAKIKIYQDVNIYVSELTKDKVLEYKINENRQVYFVQIEGSCNINGISLSDGDSMEITEENLLTIQALNNSHFLFIEMQKS